MNTDADPYKHYLQQEEFLSEGNNHAECVQSSVSSENETTTPFPELCDSGTANIEKKDSQQAVENAIDKNVVVSSGAAQPLPPIETSPVNNSGNELLSESGKKVEQTSKQTARSQHKRKQVKFNWIDQLILVPQQSSTPSKYRSNIPKGTSEFRYGDKMFTINIEKIDKSEKLDSGNFGSVSRVKIEGLPNDCMAIKIASALRILHKKGIIHRDIKPDNMLINKDAIVKLCDFGVSVDLNEDSDSFFDGGTESYRPSCPQSSPSIQDDMWSLGISLLEIINNQHPFHNECLNDLPFKLLKWKPEIPSRVSDEIQQLIRDLLQLNPEKRPPSYDDILNRPVISSMPQMPSNDERDFAHRIIEKIS
ncbi:unnamed protein product [Rotaria sp. Silwood2]|nr:unnamed protein product [Rotaria sp. Silwood2]